MDSVSLLLNQSIFLRISSDVAENNPPVYVNISTRLLMFSLVTTVLLIVSYVMIFKKAGLEGWKVFIPFYNIYCINEIAFKGKYSKGTKIVFDILGYIYFVYNVYSLIRPIYALYLFHTKGIRMVYNYFQLLLIPLIAIVGLVYIVFFDIGLSKAFGQKDGFIVGLIFLRFVFCPIIAFSKKIVYVGHNNSYPNNMYNMMNSNNNYYYNNMMNNNMINNNMMNNQVMNNQVMNNQVINNQGINNQVMNNQVMNNQGVNNQVMNNQDINNQNVSASNIDNQNNDNV